MTTVVQETSGGEPFASGYSEVKSRVKTLTDLSKKRVSKFVTGDAVFVSGEGSNYIWVSDSKLEGDESRVIIPNSYRSIDSSVGRWIIEGTKEIESISILDTDSIAEVLNIKLSKKTISDLANARVSLRDSGDGAIVTSKNQIFVWTSSSTLPANGTTVILPNSYLKADHPVGRWLLEGVSLRTGQFPETQETQTSQITSLNNLVLPVRSLSFTDSPVSVLDTDGVLLLNTLAGNIDVTVPDPGTIPVGRIFTITKVDHSLNVVNISTVGDALLDTLASITLHNIGGVSLVSDGTNYFVLP